MTKIDKDVEKSIKEALIKDILSDFETRQEERRAIEKRWELNMNFLCGNQYCDVNALGEIEQEKDGYFWQTKRVFNYIAPTVDTRCAKLARVRPALAVRPASNDESDLHSASLASAILSGVCDEQNVDDLITNATVWSETCGSVFYKVIWDNYGGKKIAEDENGNDVFEGGVKIVVVSPFEIYPYSLSESQIENQPSIIHAQAVSVQDIYSVYGVKLVGRDIDEFSLSPYSMATHSHTKCGGTIKAVKRGYEVVIERYTLPTAEYPEGRLSVVAGEELLYDGALPYINGENGKRTYPFVKQNCINMAGSFFGASIVDRLVPVQRAYNSVKNRKHEFLNRISMGTVAVEDGSVDTDELIEDGLAPGKIIVYRQGSTPPEMLTLGSIPADFSEEEDRLIEEFSKISGTGDITQQSEGFNAVTSATGLQLIIEQDEARLNISYDQIKGALKQIGKFVLRLFRQFACDLRLMRYAETDKSLALFYFKGSDISSDDVVLEADSDINMTPAQRRTVIYELISKGLFSDDEGKMNKTVKNKLLQELGYNSFCGERDISALHRARACEENLELMKKEVFVRPYDDDEIHINEHTAFLLTESYDASIEERVCRHIENHKKAKKENVYGQLNDQN